MCQVAREAGAREVFSTRLNPLHGAPELERADDGAHVSRVDRDLVAKATTQVRRNHIMPIKDSLIATTALAHNLVVVTRNRSDFAKAGVEIVDPFVQ